MHKQNEGSNTTIGVGKRIGHDDKGQNSPRQQKQKISKDKFDILKLMENYVNVTYDAYFSSFCNEMILGVVYLIT